MGGEWMDLVSTVVLWLGCLYLALMDDHDDWSGMI